MNSRKTETERAPKSYKATADDGSVWTIDRALVVADMEAYDKEHGLGNGDDITRPFPEEQVSQWVFDNCDKIEGWVFHSMETPAPFGLSEAQVHEYEEPETDSLEP